MNGNGYPRVLLVDDEENVLHGVARQVRGYLRPELLTSPVAAARLLEETDPQGPDRFAAIMSDMRMPEMDGAALLTRAAAVAPETTRLLLTGYTDMDTAIAAVNEGNIFRFLTKPCPPSQLHGALKSAVEQHQLVRDRRELLDSTLRGAVEALIETLAMAHPAGFARASRLGRLCREVVGLLGEPDSWQIEIAAQLGEIGLVTLPPAALEILIRGGKPDPTLARMLEALPDLADGVLRRIPRLEPVREIVRAQEPVDDPNPDRLVKASRPARIVQAVREYDALTTRDHSPAMAIQVLRQRRHHEPEVIDALQAVVSASEDGAVREIDVEELTPGLVLAADLRSSSGMLLVNKGHRLTEEMVARIRNFSVLSGVDGRPLIVDGR